MEVLFEDNHLLVVNKPAGQLVQGDRTGRPTLLDEGRAWLRRKYAKPGNVFLGLVHRIDRPASGVVVLARTSKAASRLAEEFRNHRPRKVYWALVEGEVPPRGRWQDRLERDGFHSRVVDAPHGKEARLSFRRLRYEQGVSLVRIDLETGRHHQIRVQFSQRGFPILGDDRYGSRRPFAAEAIGLHARELAVRHPTRHEEQCFVGAPGHSWQAFVGDLR